MMLQLPVMTARPFHACPHPAIHWIQESIFTSSLFNNHGHPSIVFENIEKLHLVVMTDFAPRRDGVPAQPLQP